MIMWYAIDSWDANSDAKQNAAQNSVMCLRKSLCECEYHYIFEDHVTF